MSTNRDKLQQQFKKAINEGYRYSETGLEEAASNCTSVCMEAMGGFANFISLHYRIVGEDVWADKIHDIRYTTQYLLTLYSNLNNK